jgi:inorganic pyrophosphatase
MMQTRFPWARWERLVREHGVTVERPAREPHPEYAEIIYPLDYGYIPDTVATDGDPVDCFIGSRHQESEEASLAGLILTTDHRKGDREAKLLVDCTAPEIYTAHGFINYDRTLLDGLLVLRHPMHEIWRETDGG